MRNLVLKIDTLITISFLVGLSLTSCRSDPDPTPTPGPTPTPPTPTPNPVYSIVGEWYEDASTNDYKQIVTSNFKEDGTCVFWNGILMQQLNLNYNENGTYSISEKRLTTKYVDGLSGENTVDVLDVQTLDNYNLFLYNPKESKLYEQHRIIATYNMTVGESKRISVNDDEFVPTSFSSTDQRVAVAQDMTVKALKRGTCYVSIKASIGTAVIRVIVTDPDNAIDDYLAYLDESLDIVTKDFGNYCFEEEIQGKPFKSYQLFDEYVSKVVFYYNPAGLVTQVFADVRYGTNADYITEALKKKYNLSNVRDGSYFFNTVKNGREVTIIWDPVSLFNITYQYRYEDAQKGTYEDYDNLILQKVEQAAKQLKTSLTDDELAQGYFGVYVNSDLFKGVLVRFDTKTHEVTGVQLHCPLGLARDDIEGWYKEHYFETSISTFSYVNYDSKGKDKNGNSVKEGESYGIRFGIDSSDGNTYVSYEKIPINLDVDQPDKSREAIIESFDKFIDMNAMEIAKFLGYNDVLYPVDGDYTFAVSDNELFSSVFYSNSVLYFGRFIISENKTVKIKCCKGITISDIDWWYKEHYDSGSPSHIYKRKSEDSGLYLYDYYVDYEKDIDGIYICYTKTRGRIDWRN